MTDPIRVLHFADVHVGMENYGRLDPATGTSSRVRRFPRPPGRGRSTTPSSTRPTWRFSPATPSRTATPSRPSSASLPSASSAWPTQIPTLLLVGNHDMPGMAAKASSVDIFQALDVPGVIVGHKAEAAGGRDPARAGVPGVGAVPDAQPPAGPGGASGQDDRGAGGRRCGRRCPT